MKRALPFLILFLLAAANAVCGDVSGRRKALRELSQRAASLDPKALYDLASLHDKGYDSIPVDSARSTALYRLSASLGYPRAQNYLGFRYFKGEFVRQNVDSALFWLTKAAENGDPSAANNLGYLLSEGDVVGKDYAGAAFWLKKAAAAGLPQAESQLADLFCKGHGVEKDTAEAISLYNRAIEGGLRDAEIKLLAMMGKKWERLPADSAVSLGRFYYSHRAPVAAVTLFENAAASGNPDALALLGDAYSKGYGVEYNHDISIDFFLRAANAGQPSAQFIIAELLDIFPDALPDSVPPAVFWYGKAAASGITDASEATQRLIYGRSD